MTHPFIEHLVKSGLLSSDEGEIVERNESENRQGIVANLTRLSDISETRIARNLAVFYQLPSFNYSKFTVEQAATELVDRISSVRLGLLPYRFSSDEALHAVCSDPELVSRMVDELGVRSGHHVILEVGPFTAVRELAAFVHYGRSFSSDLEATFKNAQQSDETEFDNSFHEILSIDEPSEAQLIQQSEMEFVRSNSNASGASSLDHKEDLDLVVDRHLARIADLNRDSFATEWDNEDTVVRESPRRDEELKNLYFRNFARSPNNLVPLDEVIEQHQTKEHRTSALSSISRLAEPFEEDLPEGEFSKDFDTPAHLLTGEKKNDALMIQLVLQSSLIDELRDDVTDLQHIVKMLQEQNEELIKLLETHGIIADSAVTNNH